MQDEQRGKGKAQSVRSKGEKQPASLHFALCPFALVQFQFDPDAKKDFDAR
jgi:hypothetical protein